MTKIKRGFQTLLRAALGRLLACAMAAVIFFESCTQYDIAPRGEVARDGTQRRAVRRRGGMRAGGYGSAIQLAPEDRVFWDKLNAVMRRASESPGAARAILAEQASMASDDTLRLDAFTLSLVRVLGDAELQAAIMAQDKKAIVARLLTLRDGVQIDDAMRARLIKIMENAGLISGDDIAFLDASPQSIVFPVLVIAWCALAVSVIGAAAAIVLAASEAWVLGTEDKIIPTAYGADAFLVLDSIHNRTLRYQVEEELAAHYEREIFEYLRYFFPRDDVQQQRKLAERAVKIITGHREP